MCQADVMPIHCVIAIIGSDTDRLAQDGRVVNTQKPKNETFHMRMRMRMRIFWVDNELL